MAKRLHRSEVPEEMTWNLTDLFTDRKAWENALEAASEAIGQVTAFKGSAAKNGEQLLACLKSYESFSSKLVQLGTYAHLLQAEDGTNPLNQESSMKFASISTKLQTETAFIEAELLALDQKEFESLFLDEPLLDDYRMYLEDLYNSKQHKLSPETEETLLALGELSGAPQRIYMVSKAADMVFEGFEDETGEILPNSFALFETKHEFSPSAIIRKNAYSSFVKTLGKYKNTYAAVYSAEVKKQIALRRLRRYDSVFEMLLENQKVSVDMYNRQIDVIFNKMAPHMQQFAKLKQRALGLDTMSYWDLKAPLDVAYNPPATFESAKEIILEALSVLGEDYLKGIKRAFDERWIDYSDNIGKSTGAFCSSPYGVHPYILISFQNNMRSAFTLAHELGHAGHFYLANQSQTILNTRPSLYCIESPSTMNEMILGRHLMAKTDDPMMKRWVIIQLLGTYYHNFVTHIIEAEFQRRVYQFAEDGGSLTAKYLCETMVSVLKTFWGDSVEIDEAAGMTWMRQPHYYMGLYPYTYSAGLTASTAVSEQIQKEGQPAVDRWLNMLKAGGTLKPNELLKLAGIDMSTSEPIEKAVAYVGSLIQTLDELF